jgi:hypothetical protein
MIIVLLPLPSSSSELLPTHAILQGLDKVSGRVKAINAPIGETMHFGTLEFIVRTCQKKPPEETPETAIFIDIWDVKIGEPALGLFRGWMFASSPALSALEHPVYDLWVIDCIDHELDLNATTSSKVNLH